MWNCTHFSHPTDEQLRNQDMFRSHIYLKSVPCEVSACSYITQIYSLLLWRQHAHICRVLVVVVSFAVFWFAVLASINSLPTPALLFPLFVQYDGCLEGAHGDCHAAMRADFIYGLAGWAPSEGPWIYPCTNFHLAVQLLTRIKIFRSLVMMMIIL